MVTNLLDAGGFWVIQTKSSNYVLDAEKRLMKRLPNSSHIDGYEVASLRKDGDWFQVIQLQATIGESMIILGAGISEQELSEGVVTARQTTPVLSIKRSL